LGTRKFNKETLISLINGAAPTGYEILEANHHKITPAAGRMQFKEVVFGFEGKHYVFMYDLVEGWEKVSVLDFGVAGMSAHEVVHHEFCRPGWEVLPIAN